MPPEGAAAEHESSPQGDRIGCVCRYNGNAGKQQTWKSDEAPSSGNCIEYAAEHGRNKQKNGSLKRAEMWEDVQSLKDLTQALLRPTISSRCGRAGRYEFPCQPCNMKRSESVVIK